MGWDQKRYYTRSRRVNGRVTREYVGTGEEAARAAQQDAVAREQRAAAREAERAQRQQDEAIDRLLDQMDEITDLLVAAAFTVAGYHRHKRGEWRKRRGRPTEGSRAGTPADQPANLA